MISHGYPVYFSLSESNVASYSQLIPSTAQSHSRYHIWHESLII